MAKFMVLFSIGEKVVNSYSASYHPGELTNSVSALPCINFIIKLIITDNNYQKYLAIMMKSLVEYFSTLK